MSFTPDRITHRRRAVSTGLALTGVAIAIPPVAATLAISIQADLEVTVTPKDKQSYQDRIMANREKRVREWNAAHPLLAALFKPAYITTAFLLTLATAVNIRGFRSRNTSAITA